MWEAAGAGGVGIDLWSAKRTRMSIRSIEVRNGEMGQVADFDFVSSEWGKDTLLAPKGVQMPEGALFKEIGRGDGLKGRAERAWVGSCL